MLIRVQMGVRFRLCVIFGELADIITDYRISLLLIRMLEKEAPNYIGCHCHDMGGFLDRLRGRHRLQPARIRSVWNSYIGSHQEYFYKVLLNVMNRDDGMSEILMPKQHAANEAEHEFVLRLLADRIAGFFHSIIVDETLTNLHELKKSCYNLGQQHSAYSRETFKVQRPTITRLRVFHPRLSSRIPFYGFFEMCSPIFQDRLIPKFGTGAKTAFFLQIYSRLTYWDAFTLALLEELENRGGTPREELRAWQALLHVINENMLAGYLDARSAMRQ
ncbi:hypothetical protein Y032_0125g1281 [Ancylostoma ceylanicum]|uniref:Globin family profile domain-containing protein n=1 Tax=Ancylostoma ceylanicum TaxID=53326 RepID=A0A016T923_9BILA|nr:hypothetical protein Y032_0125g1281 [Ancylostoma ceylanicum]